jgi:hypothetical protein
MLGIDTVELLAVTKRHAVERCVVVDPETDERFDAGASPPGVSLLDALFRDAEAVRTLNSSIEGQMLPRMWGQGAWTCVVSKLPSGLIVGCLVALATDVRTGYQQARALDADLAGIST